MFIVASLTESKVLCPTRASHLQVALHLCVAAADVAQPPPMRQEEVHAADAQHHCDGDGGRRRVLELDEGRQGQVGK